MRSAAGFQPQDPALIAANNRGVGLMGKFEFAAARDVFHALWQQHPEWRDVQVNLAIATLNRQQEGDDQQALEMLGSVLQAQPDHLHAQYCAGLLKLYLESPAEALPHFERVAHADPHDAYAAYYVGQCLSQLREYARALEWYQRAIAHDPYLRSAYYAASQAHRATQQHDQAQQMQQHFERLERNPRARLIEFKYTRMGPRSQAIVVNLADPRPPAPKPEGPMFADPVPLLTNGDQFTWTVRRDDRPVSITASDINSDGHIDIFIANALDEEGRFNAVCINKGDSPPTFTLDADHVLAAVPNVNATLWGDYDNDGLTDVYLCRRGPNMLWRQSSANMWKDVTAASRADNGHLDTVDGAMFDADHDGDLDIFCVNFDGPNELLNNNLDGPPITFRPIAQERGIAGSGSGSKRAVAVDLDGDRDLDIIVLNRRRPQDPHHQAHSIDVFINDRMWNYSQPNDYASLQSADVIELAVSDADDDGLVDLYLAYAGEIAGQGKVRVNEGPEVDLDVQSSRPWLSRWHRDASGAWQSEGAHLHAGLWQHPLRRLPMLLGDFNGDAILDVAVVGADSQANLVISLASNEPAFRPEYGPGGSAEAPASINEVQHAIEQRPVAGAALVNLDARNGPSIICITNGQPVIARPGAGRYPFATISFTGRREGETMRSNASGIGTHFAARIDSMWVMGSTLGNTAGPGQSLQPVAIGLGGHDKIDFISIDWSDGIFQTELDLDAGKHHVITETQRQLSSCPVLFAWNGERYEFISDVLGVGGLGYLIAPEPLTYSVPRPWENFMLPAGSLQPRDGRYILKLGEPMEEVCYLDAARLVAYDLPPGWRMTLDERMHIAGPAPTGEPRFYREQLLPVEAVNDRGEDVLDTIQHADQQAAPVGEIDPRFIGRLQRDHVLTLAFAQPINSIDNPQARSRRRLLIIDGWVEYPYSQTMFAAWQAGAAYRAPSVEAMGDDGQWRLVLEQFGYPAGMPRQMSVSLDDLPPNTTSLRLTTNQEIYFDRIAIALGIADPPPADVVRHELPLRRARLIQSGFATRTTGPQRQPHYDYQKRTPLWDTRYQRGWYTQPGQMTELIQATDDALAIFGPGEEIHMEFAAAASSDHAELPVLPSGWSRVFVLELNGWCKDMDLFTDTGETVEPLPLRDASAASNAARDALHRRFNTRYQSGR